MKNRKQIKPRIIFIDIHCNDFFVRHSGRIIGKNHVKSFKHQFLLNYFYENGYEVCNYITRNGTRIRGRFRMFTKNRIGRYLESIFVEKVNHLPHFKVLTNKHKITPNDIVIGYLVFDYQIDILNELVCYKVLFGNHFISTNNSLDLKNLGINAFVNEIDLSNNEFVTTYFNLNGVDNLIVPYTFQNRFVVNKDFSERENKAMAIGTSSTCSIVPNRYKLYREFFNTELIQPMRQLIFEKQDELSDIIDCYISPILENHGRQTKYTSFDMVETFNKYRMFVCPEELVGMPGIGFVEGMACGCAYIGLNHDMYRCLGLEPGIHYITYDGTLEDLRKVILYYKQRPEEVKNIADTGCRYVRENFNMLNVAEKFENQLINSYNNYTCHL